MAHELSIILILVLMEGLLSADNALVLATMANKIKDPEKRKKALYYGMVGAVGFRMFFIMIGTWMIKLWALKLVGALYLAKLSYDHFSKKEEDADNDGIIDKYQRTPLHKLLGKFGITLTTFWSVVISIEIMDLAFSVDSILAALALSDKFWVLALGGILGIAMMRGVAGFFMKLIERVPEMEHTAFVLIGIIALKMFLGTIHNIVGLFGVHMHEIHIPHLLFFGILIVTFGATFVINKINTKKGKHTQVSK